MQAKRSLGSSVVFHIQYIVWVLIMSLCVEVLHLHLILSGIIALFTGWPVSIAVRHLAWGRKRSMEPESEEPPAVSALAMAAFLLTCWLFAGVFRITNRLAIIAAAGSGIIVAWFAARAFAQGQREKQESANAGSHHFS